MTILRELVYHGLAFVAMLAYLFLAGLFLLLMLTLTPPPGAELAAFAVRSVAVIGWVGLGFYGLRSWARHSWEIVAVPFLAFGFVIAMLNIGNAVVHWTLGIGY